ncbi:MAG: Hsp20/alpha crystallin family protein [PVC group bacterium]|nr:Hsp20/alpha crystallin family protein [PVC group bacterium]
MNKTYSSTMLLGNMIDEVFNVIDSVTTPALTSGSIDTFTYNGDYTTNCDPYFLKPIDPYWTNYHISYIPEAPKHPKTACHITDNGTVVLEIVITGFDRDDIDVKREGETIIISASRDNIECKSKEVWNDISKKKFETSFCFNDKMDLDKINLKIENGILIIEVPMKEEHKPVVKQLEIK